MKNLFFVLTILLSFNAFAESALLSKLKGEVKINGVVAKEGQKVQTGEEISALGKTSSVQLTYEDGSRSLLRNGKMKIAGDSSDKETIIELAQGILFASKNKSQKSFSVKTKSASMGVRGTKFYVEEKADETYLCVCEGSVEIKNAISSQLVNKNEDAHVKENTEFKKTPANDMMMTMAKEGFIEMGLLN